MSRTERKQQSVTDKKHKKNSRKARFEEGLKEKDITETGKNKKRKGRFVTWFKGLKTWKKVLFVTAITLLVLILVLGTIAYCYFNDLFNDVHEATPEDYDLSLVDVDGYYNILLLGVDSRDMDNLKGTRSDAIMMVSINKDTNDVKILSVYRDTYLKIGDTSTYDKITHACVYGGPEMTMKSLNQAMDLNISNYVVVNFKAVADLVDAVGGIEVDVQEYEIQQLNKYTIETAENIGRKNYKLVEKAGVQTLEGVQAVSYGRIRKGVGDDFKRTERMRTVITLVMDKMKDMSFKDIKKIIKMMTPQIQTNLSKTNILALGIRLPQYNIIGTDGWPYNVTTGYISGISYVFPSNLSANATELHKKFFGQENYTPSAKVASISNMIMQRIEAERNSGALENEEKVDVNTSHEIAKPPVDNNTGNNQGGENTGEGGNTGTGGNEGTGSGNEQGGNTGEGGNTGTGGNEGTGSGNEQGGNTGEGGNTGGGESAGGGNTGTGNKAA